MQVLLDGRMVAADSVTPERARFVGMWRPPVNPMADPGGDVLCTCGETLRFRGQETAHYVKGCYDTPQYVGLSQRSASLVIEPAIDLREFYKSAMELLSVTQVTAIVARAARSRNGEEAVITEQRVGQ
jgi:hypothetical protein